jgi:hypothetical protein
VIDKVAKEGLIVVNSVGTDTVVEIVRANLRHNEGTCSWVADVGVSEDTRKFPEGFVPVSSTPSLKPPSLQGTSFLSHGLSHTCGVLVHTVIHVAFVPERPEGYKRLLRNSVVV